MSQSEESPSPIHGLSGATLMRDSIAHALALSLSGGLMLLHQLLPCHESLLILIYQTP